MNKAMTLRNRERSTLVQAPFIGAGDEAVTAKFMEAATIVTVPARQILFRQGETAQYLFCVLNGYVRLYRLSRDGREADVRICGPGEAFNECLIFGADKYQHNAQAADSCTLARFDLERVRSMIEEEPKIVKAVLHSMSNSLRTTMDCLANDRLQTAPQRVANYLIAQGPADANCYSLRLPFQKSVLAGKLGLAPEALSRAFSSLRDAGVIVRGRLIQVNDVSALRHF